MRRVLIGLAAVVGFGVIGLGLAAYLALRASLPELEGEQALNELEGEVTVLRDAQGVVTLGGSDPNDLAFATGFVHAQDRFFQMDTLRRSAAGELSALFGPVALDFDRERRRWRGRAYMRQTLDALPEDQRRLISAYARGVNAGLDTLSARPPEYWLLRARPEPWQAEDSLLAGLSMFFYLTDYQAIRDLRLDQMAETLPQALLDFLLDPADSMDAPLVEEPFPAFPSLPGPDDFDVREFQDVVMDYQSVVGGVTPLAGSNSWAVDAQVGQGDQARLAGDMHLGIAQPNTWYRLRIEETGDSPVNLTGVSLPGVPGVIAGSNGHVAWAFTNSYGDWSTRVRLTQDPDKTDHYLTPAGSQVLDHHEEVIQVRGGEDETVMYPWTQWGPVKESESGESHVLVWTGAMPGALNFAFRALHQAEDLDAALRAGAGLGMPPQNLLVVDRTGRIGWGIAGQIPRRGNWAQAGEHLPTSEAFHLSEGWLAADDFPRLTDPDHGRLWTANARVASGENLSKVGDGGYPLGARQRQIRDRLFEDEAFDEAGLLGIQLDDEARLLYEWVPLALAAADAGVNLDGADRFRGHIAAWHGHAWPDSTGYPLLRDFRLAVHGRVLGPLLHPTQSAHSDFNLRPIRKRERAVRTLLAERPAHLLAADFEHWDALLVDAMASVIDKHKLADPQQPVPTWGQRNPVEIAHPMGQQSDLLGRWLNLPRAELPGDVNMPRVQVNSFGASQRMVVSPGQEEHGIFHMPGGQSGHFLSPWYDAGHQDWEKGRASPFLPGPPQFQLTLSGVDDD